MSISPILANTEQGDPQKLLVALRSRGLASRAELTDLTGLPQSTVSLRIRELLAAGVLVENAAHGRTGGRRAGLLEFAPDAGTVLAIELAADQLRWRIADLAGAPRAEGGYEITISDGANTVLGPVEAAVREGMASLDLPIDRLRACVVGFPGPVNPTNGRTLGPPHTVGWEHEPIATLLSEWIEGPVAVDNDVNVMAWGEYNAKWREEGVRDVLFIMHGDGIGCGIIANGQMLRGADGTAGEVGHIAVSDLSETVLCRCGGRNCLEAVASGQALIKRLQEHGTNVETVADVSRLVREGDVVTLDAVRQAGRALGTVMSGIISFANPAVIVMGGSLGAVAISVLTGMREAIYAHATMISTGNLRIQRSSLGKEAALHGATLLALDLAYESVDQLSNVSGDAYDRRLRSTRQR